MKKTVWVNLVKQRINLKTFESLEKKNKSHSKVEQIEHTAIIDNVISNNYRIKYPICMYTYGE